MKGWMKKGLGLVLVLAILVGGCYLVTHREKGPELTNELVASKLQPASELTVAHLTYRGLLHYEEGKVPFITKKAFFMVYEAEVSAWIDLSEVEIEITEEQVTVTLPSADEEHVKIYVLPESITFYNEKAALLNWESKEDAVTALAKAEADVWENAGVPQLMAAADQQAEALAEQLLADCLDGRALVIQHA